MRGRGEMQRSSAPRGRLSHHGEFDPGSERTLAARLKHASRAGSGRLRPVRAADW